MQKRLPIYIGISIVPYILLSHHFRVPPAQNASAKFSPFFIMKRIRLRMNTIKGTSTFLNCYRFVDNYKKCNCQSNVLLIAQRAFKWRKVMAPVKLIKKKNIPTYNRRKMSQNCSWLAVYYVLNFSRSEVGTSTLILHREFTNCTMRS